EVKNQEKQYWDPHIERSSEFTISTGRYVIRRGERFRSFLSARHFLLNSLKGAGDLFNQTLPADHSMDNTQRRFKRGAQIGLIGLIVFMRSIGPISPISPILSEEETRLWKKPRGWKRFSRRRARMRRQKSATPLSVS